MFSAVHKYNFMYNVYKYWMHPKTIHFPSFYNLRLGSTIPVFLDAPVGVSEAAEDLRVILVVPLVLLEPEGFRVLIVVEVLEVMVCVADVFCLNVGILLVE